MIITKKRNQEYLGWKSEGRGANPIKGYDFNKPYKDSSNQLALKNGKLKLGWYDYLFTPFIGGYGTAIVQGLLNSKY